MARRWPKRGWPWEAKAHIKVDSIKVDAEKWMRSYDGVSDIFVDKIMQDDFPSIACLIYAHQDEPACQLAARVMLHFFVIDEITDQQDEADVRSLSTVLMKAFKSDDRQPPPGSSVAARMAIDIGILYRNIATKESWELFTAWFSDYLDGVADEAASRQMPVLDVASYMSIRRKTIGLRPCIALMLIDCAAPATFLKTYEAETLISLCVDIIAYQNDVYSFNKEQAKGEDGHNAVRILMEQHGVGPQEATYQLVTETEGIIDHFVAIAENLPSLENETENGHLRTLRDGCVSWIIGMEVWTTRITKRYGMQDLDENRAYTLMLKRAPEIAI